MTVQQHAPRLEQVRPPFAISNAAIIAIGIVLIAVLAAVAIWAFFESGATVDYYDAERQLQQLREAIGGGGFI